MEHKNNPKKSLRNKIDNFLYHYKYLAIFGLLVIILASSLIYTIIDKQIEKNKIANESPANIEIMIFGEYEADDLTPLEENIKELFPDWDDVDINLVFSPPVAYSHEEMAAMQKSKVTIKKETPDIYILDLHFFNQFKENGPFLALNPYKVIEEVAEKTLLSHQDEDGIDHTYGINLTGNKLFSGLEISTGEMIAVVHSDAKNKENALALLSKVTNDTN